MKNKISIIILTYNSNDLIIGCIESIIKSSKRILNEIEIIVVDNSSLIIFEELNKIIYQQFKDLNLIVHHNPKNGGYGYGNNIGISLAKYEIICIMNPDVIIKKNIFHYVDYYFTKYTDLALLGGKQYGGKNLSYFLKPEYQVPILGNIITKLSNKFNIYNQKYFFLSGAFLFIKKDIFYEIGLFDESIFLYGEESDIITRFTNLNKKCIYAKEVEYNHLISNRNKFDIKTYSNLLKSREIYFKKFTLNFKKYLLNQRVDLFVKLIYAKIFSKNYINDLLEMNKELSSYLKKK